MPMITDSFKNTATAAMTAKYGADEGKAYALLVFGGPGTAGVIDDAHLTAAAGRATTTMSSDAILGLVSSAAKSTLASSLEAKAAPYLATAGLTAAAVAQAAQIVVNGFVAPGTAPGPAK
jgi:hypothetical protein